jgi:hypothetical protein
MLKSSNQIELIGNIHNAVTSWFINARNGDLHILSSANEAIDTAKASGIVRKDYDNENRPKGSAYDIGADEY